MSNLFKEFFEDVFGKDFDRFQNDFDGFMDDIYKSVEVPSFILSKGTYPKVNIQEKEKSFNIVAATPGLSKEDIEVTFDDGMLTIRGKSNQNKKSEEDKFIIRELKKSNFMRSFKVNSNKIDINKIKCSYINGELTVTIPKKEKEKGKNSMNFDIS